MFRLLSSFGEHQTHYLLYILSPYYHSLILPRCWDVRDPSQWLPLPLVIALALCTSTTVVTIAAIILLSLLAFIILFYFFCTFFACFSGITFRLFLALFIFAFLVSSWWRYGRIKDNGIYSAYRREKKKEEPEVRKG